ncbi:MAG: hypothetical protein IPO62_17840 [Saprospiraceae bacterium]|nr:hypothetical protein [Saprospiraceae bacterium]
MTELNLTPYKIIEGKNLVGDHTLKVAKSDFQSIPFQDGKITLAFSDCRFHKILIENTESINFKAISIQFISCFITEIQVNSIETENISIHFNNSILSGTIKSHKISTVSLNNSIIRNGLFLLNQKAINISYTEENIFPIKWKRLLKSINVENATDVFTARQAYYIYDSKKISFSTREAKDKKAGFYKSDFNRTGDYKIGYYLSKAQKSSFNLNLAIFYSQSVEESETKVIDSNFYSLSITGYLNGNLHIENTKIENWFIRNFSGEKEVNFFNISPLKLASNESKFEIHKCNLDNSWFDNIDFSEYKTVSFYKIKFGKTTFTSCNFPTDYTSFEKFQTLENVLYPENKSDNYYKNQYELFLQLKMSLEASGNFYESQKLKAISNDALKKIKQISNWDKAILLINSKSNHHGLSIKRPLLYFFGFSISFYILYLLSLGRIFNYNDIDYTLLGYYFSFIDLTHRPDFLVTKEEFNFFSLTLDFVNKIIIGFFIYQFFSAFRKYGKT